MTLTQETHRPSSLKQKNKKHCPLGHKSKRAVAKINKGKVNKIIVKRKAKVKLTKTQLKNQENQKRKHKKDKTMKYKRSLGTNDTAPFLILVIPMSQNIKSHYVIDALCMGDSEAVVDVNLDGVTHIGCKRFKKRLSFIAPSVTDWTSILDAVKVSDNVLFVWDANEEDMMEEGKMLMTVLKSQGLPTIHHCISGLDFLSQKKKTRSLKELKKDLSIVLPEQSKVFSLDNKQETLLLLRQLAEQKKHEVFFRDKRSHMLAEEVEFVEQTNGFGTLKVKGYIRGQHLSANNVIHIPGWENYQIECIEGLEDPHLMGKMNFVLSGISAGEKVFPNPELQRSLDLMTEASLTDQDRDTEFDMSETEVSGESDNEEGEGSSDGSLDEEEIISDEFESAEPIDDHESSMEDDSDAQFFGDAVENKTGAAHNADQLSDVDDENYDSHVDYDAELQSLKESREQEVQDNREFPDEIDTPFDEQARERFRKYRGLESFRTSPWDHRQNLPVNFKRIISFKNYNYMRKTVFKTKQNGVKTGSYVCVHLKNVSKDIYDGYVNRKFPIVLFSLLENEQRMSMLNVVLKSHSSGHVDAIKSKERLVFHVGFRRYSNCPIFSEHVSGSKFLFLRYFHPSTTVVASMLAPVTYSPCPVTVFKEGCDGKQDLIATGSVYSVNEKRIICKRICLSGHPFKIKPNVTVVRYMFFNREDIEHFKPILLRSKWGSRGKIMGPIGTHGHMKCYFKEKLNSQDVIFLTMYKRAFPKLTYEPLVRRMRNIDSYSCSDDEDCSNISSIEPKRKKQKTVHFSSD